MPVEMKEDVLRFHRQLRYRESDRAVPLDIFLLAAQRGLPGSKPGHGHAER